VKARDRHYTT